MKKLTVVALIVVILAASVTLGQLAGTSDEYSRYNSGWNGTSLFYGSVSDENCIYDFADLAGKTGSMLLVIAPAEEFTGDGLLSYLNAGNTIVIFDQEGNANSFLTSIGSSIQVQNEPVRSSDMEYKDTGLFRADVLVNLFGTNVSHLFFNYPGYVTGGEPFIQTSSLVWVDTDGDNTADADETLKVYSLAASEIISNGKVVVVADPSLFVNSMLDRKHTENMAVLTALLAENPYVCQTETMTEDGGGITGFLSLLHRFPALGVTLLGAVFLAAGSIYLWRRRKL